MALKHPQIVESGSLLGVTGSTSLETIYTTTEAGSFRITVTLQQVSGPGNAQANVYFPVTIDGVPQTQGAGFAGFSGTASQSVYVGSGSAFQIQIGDEGGGAWEYNFYYVIELL